MKPAWDYKWELPDCNLKPHCGVDALPEALSQLRLQVAVTWDFPALFESRC